MLFLRPHTIEIAGRSPGPTLLITGGVDGDEYAGMEAARVLAERFSHEPFSGRLIIIPVVNQRGFLHETSMNPRDGLYPKHIFPGNRFGTDSMRLVSWLVRNHVSRASVWLDLHGGAMTERVNPFLWRFDTGVRDIDDLSRRIFSAARAELILTETVHPTSKAATLARKGCLYMIAESGDRGIVDAESVARHVEWTLTTMHVFGMLPEYSIAARIKQPRELHSFHRILAPYDGRYEPESFTAHHTDGRRERIAPPDDATLLWWKVTPAMRRGDILTAYGTP